MAKNSNIRRFSHFQTNLCHFFRIADDFLVMDRGSKNRQRFELVFCNSKIFNSEIAHKKSSAIRIFCHSKAENCQNRRIFEKNVTSLPCCGIIRGIKQPRLPKLRNLIEQNIHPAIPPSSYACRMHNVYRQPVAPPTRHGVRRAVWFVLTLDQTRRQTRCLVSACRQACQSRRKAQIPPPSRASAIEPPTRHGVRRAVWFVLHHEGCVSTLPTRRGQGASLLGRHE